MASGIPVPARACAQARTVPSPPTANTSDAPAATAPRVRPRPVSAGLVSANTGSQPAARAAVRQRHRNRCGSRTSVPLITNATDGMVHCARARTSMARARA